MLAVAVLVLLSGGVGYAAGQITSRDIKDGTVQGRDIRNGTIVGRDVKQGSIPRDRLAPGCPPGQSRAFGGCVSRVPDGRRTFEAVADCNSRNGRLPSILELKWIASNDDRFTWTNGNPDNYEFSGDFTTTSPHTPIALDQAGNSISNTSAQTFWYHYVRR